MNRLDFKSYLYLAQNRRYIPKDGKYADAVFIKATDTIWFESFFYGKILTMEIE